MWTCWIWRTSLFSVWPITWWSDNADYQLDADMALICPIQINVICSVIHYLYCLHYLPDPSLRFIFCGAFYFCHKLHVLLAISLPFITYFESHQIEYHNFWYDVCGAIHFDGVFSGPFHSAYLQAKAWFTTTRTWSLRAKFTSFRSFSYG